MFCELLTIMSWRTPKRDEDGGVVKRYERGAPRQQTEELGVFDKSRGLLLKYGYGCANHS